MERLLAIQIKRIGDLILTAPALARLRRAKPEAHLTLVTMGAAGQLVPAIPSVDQHFSYHYGRPNLRLWVELALGGYDVALDFNGSDRSVLMTWVSQADVRATYTKRAKGRWREIVYTHTSRAPLRKFHTIDHMHGLLDVLDLQPIEGSEPEPPSLVVPGETLARVDRLLGERGVQGPFFVVHPGTARPEKYWLPERWAEVIDAIGSGPKNWPCVITGGNDGAECRHIEGILRVTRHRPIMMAGQLSLLETAGVIQRASLALGVDTAAMHLAAALQRPQVALFGPTNPFHWRPRNDLCRVVVPDRDGPLGEGDLDPRAEERPMSGVRASAVLAAVESLK
ncbi:MAG: glycosyltransferase family 9 protein [Verrucomicrobiae bacterium]|nr:glycosyltransferase family 9 protein [Verrucomicrobiae bacterium]